MKCMFVVYLFSVEILISGSDNQVYMLPFRHSVHCDYDNDKKMF